MKSFFKKNQFSFFILIILLASFLRLYNISQNPPGLYIDEVSIGYNAHSILQSGRDEHGQLLPLFFKAFGEYKMPVYIYSVVGSMIVFGHNELAVRFPSALSGILTTVLFYFFLKKVIEISKFKNDTQIKKFLPIIATFLLTISSWHIHFSRGGFEVTQGSFFYLVGLYLSLLFWERKSFVYLLIGMLFFILSMYTYNTFRIITPITWLIINLTLLTKFPMAIKKVLSVSIVFLLLCIPLLQFSMTSQGAARFAQASAFSEYKADTFAQKTLVYPIVYLKNYLSFFSLDFLFGFGDGNGRHQIAGYGLLYRWQFPFFILGIVWFIKQKKSFLKYTVFMLLAIAPISAALARPSPHSLRALSMIFPLAIIISLGIICAFEVLKKWKILFVLVIIAAAIYEFTVYQHYYYFHYPKVNARDWGSANKEMVIKTSKLSKKYDYIVVDGYFASSDLYFRFYDDKLRFKFVDADWVKPKEWGNKNVLYVRPFYGNKEDQLIIDQVYLPSNNNDIYAQFWKL